jgi:hypothetical protein
MMDDAVAMETVGAGVGDNALQGPGLLLGGPAEQVPVVNPARPGARW